MIPPEARIPPNTGVLIERVFSVVELSLLVSILSIETSFRFGELFVLKSNDFYAVVFSFFFLFMRLCWQKENFLVFSFTRHKKKKKSYAENIFLLGNCFDFVVVVTRNRNWDFFFFTTDTSSHHRFLAPQSGLLSS